MSEQDNKRENQVNNGTKLDSSRYTTSFSAEQLAAAERAVKEQAIRDKEIEKGQQISKEQAKQEGRIAGIRAIEAKKRAELKMQETERMRREAEEAKARVQELSRQRENVELKLEQSEDARAREQERLEQRNKLLGSKSTRLSHMYDFSASVLTLSQEKAARELEEAARAQEEERKRQKELEEQRRIQAELEAKRRAELAAELARAKAAEEERRRKAEQLRIQKEREEAEALRRKKAEEDARRLEEERRRQEEEDRKRQEAERIKEERARAKAERMMAKAKEKALLEKQKEEERLRKLAEELKKKEEKARAEAARKQDRARAEKAKKEEKARVEEARKQEKERIEEAKKQERVRAEEAKREALRKKQEEKARVKAEKQARADAKAEAKASARAEASAKKASARRAKDRKNKEDRDKLIALGRAVQKEKRAEAQQEAKKKRKHLARRKNAERNAKNKAKKGGGIINYADVQLETDLVKVPTFSLRTLLGLEKVREIRAASSEEEKQKLRIQIQQRKIKAREILLEDYKSKLDTVKGSRVADFFRDLFVRCEKKKKEIIVGGSIALMLLVGAAGVMNFYTAYEYSYNGTQLGYVKEKDTVLQITEMVQSALTADKNLDVVIDARDDISFKRVWLGDKDVVIDDADAVLKRLTYMGDLNVKAYGIYVDGKKVGAVADKDTAALVMEELVNTYTSDNVDSELESFSFVETVVLKESNTDLREVLSEEEMLVKLTTSGVKTSVYTIAKGDTLANIARDHALTEEEIIEDNKGINPEKLEVGSTIVIEETAPLIQVKTTEVRSYEAKTDYKVIKKKNNDVYEGSTEVEREGKKGLSEVTDRTVSINGEVVETINIKNKVKEEPIDKIVSVGTKERPPAIGTGTYIWPAYTGTYTVTSEFKWRWGRQHQGIDMGCPTGTDVLASDGGTVTYSGYMGGYGNLVIIDHENGVETYYGHNSALCVKVGDKVFQGQHIAEAGNTGRSFGSHIHFGVKDNGTFYNPRNYLP